MKTFAAAALMLLSVTAAFAAQQPSAAPDAAAKIEIPLKNWAINFEGYLTPKAVAQATTGKIPLQARTDAALPSNNTTFVAIAPCRQYDSRNSAILAGGGTRTVAMAGAPCGVPAGATAFSIAITSFGSTASGSYGFITVYPTGSTQPGVSTFNFLGGSQTSTSAIVPAGTSDSINVFSTATTQFVLDVNGYFTSSAGTLASSDANANTLVLRDVNADFKVHSITATGTVTGAVYSDFAEWVPAVDNPAPGTVVVLDPKDGRRVMASSRAYDTSVAGVVSEHPGIVLGPQGPDRAQIATTGRVPVFADATNGPIAIGDLLVTSDIPGTAMKSVPVSANGTVLHRPGTIIGKALQPLASGKGQIMILLSLQ